MNAESIKKSLEEQLSTRGADIDAFKTLIIRYANLYELNNELAEDLTARGAIMANGKVNPSNKEMRENLKTMLAILKQLGLSIDTVRSSEHDEL